MIRLNIAFLFQWRPDSIKGIAPKPQNLDCTKLTIDINTEKAALLRCRFTFFINLCSYILIPPFLI